MPFLLLLVCSLSILLSFSLDEFAGTVDGLCVRMSQNLSVSRLMRFRAVRGDRRAALKFLSVHRMLRSDRISRRDNIQLSAMGRLISRRWYIVQFGDVLV